MANQFTKDVLTLDPEKEVNKISSRIRELLAKQLKRRGLVVALSGGIDSSVTTALAVKAIGRRARYRAAHAGAAFCGRDFRSQQYGGRSFRGGESPRGYFGYPGGARMLQTL